MPSETATMTCTSEQLSGYYRSLVDGGIPETTARELVRDLGRAIHGSPEADLSAIR